jgi:Leucine-rich repeat (LRR) protein
MKKHYFLFFLTIGLFANAQIINFSDANFKAKLLEASPSHSIASSAYITENGNPSSYSSIDTNNNGEIEISEASIITFLDLSLSSISDLTGIAFFTNLQTLICYGNELTALDISQNSILRVLDCNSNQISSLIIPQNENLIVLDCSGNYLTELDLSQNINLSILYCYNNQLSSLDVTQNPNLEFLRCHYNNLISLSVSNVNLVELYCNNNNLTYLNLTSCTKLNELNCYYNLLTTLLIKNNNLLWNNIDFSANPNLQFICTDDEDINYINQLCLNINLTNCQVNSYCSFTPGGTFYEISGNTKLDSNNNGCDVSDINYSNLNFSITDGTNTGSLIVNQTGNYYIPVSVGNHTITPNLENPSYFNVSPTSFSVNFPTQASPFAQDFCVTANGVHSDVEIVLVPTTPARPGFDATYKLVYRNKGNQIENGTVTFSMYNPDVVDFVSSLPNFNSQTTNPTLETFSWNYSNLQPFETREIDIVLNVNSPMETPPVNGGDLLSFDTQIVTSNTDENLNDNFFAIRQVVVNSYDPNDKTCLHGETIPPSEVGKYVHYVIRFENTGTFPAENIVVKDLIDLAKFDIATLVPLNSSHDFYTRINGNNVEFIFENINLDYNDATNDGYMAFKIKTLPSLVLGDTFTNNANIYFDYNFPITTNTYTTTVAALSTQDFDFGTYFTLYPNPAHDVLNSQTKQDLPINSIEVYNQLGQVVLAVTNSVNSIDVTDLASGTYFVKVNTEKGSANAKFVKE